MRFNRSFLLILLLGLWFPLPARGQNAAGGKQRGPRIVELALPASAANRPVSQYPLLPGVLDQRPGNASPLYLIAARIGPDPKAAGDLTDKLFDRFRDAPMKILASSDFPGAFQPFDQRMEVLDLAARRDDSHWETTTREQGAGTMLPYLNDMRTNVNIVSLKTRWQIARHDWSGAARSLQTGLSMSLQLNDHPLLIQGLIATGMADMMTDRIDDWITQPDSPNLYWALAELPEPFINMRSISQWEAGMIFFTFPALATGEPEQAPAEVWKGVFASFDRMRALNGEKPLTEQQLSLLVASTLPKAKESLVSRGIPRAKVEAMGVNQVVGCYWVREYLAVADEAWRGWELPYWQRYRSAEGVASNEWESRKQRVAENPMMAFIPSVRNARLQFARIDRKICVLRILEALRDHAARNNFQLPRTLDDIKSMPIPIDPVTGKPFPYNSDGASAALDVLPDSPGYPDSGTTYRLTIAR